MESNMMMLPLLLNADMKMLPLLKPEVEYGKDVDINAFDRVC